MLGRCSLIPECLNLFISGELLDPARIRIFELKGDDLVSFLVGQLYFRLLID